MVGRRIGHYQILEKLGSGGMGEIFKAQDPRLNRFVAIKSLSASGAEDPERRRRFTQEAQAASALNHPNIITIYDVLTEGGTDYMVMEFIAGRTLAERIPKGGLAVAEALQYGVQIADALRTAHAAGIIHRDLKPGNVMVTDSGLVKVLDFGLAKIDTAALSEETQTLRAAPMTIEGSILGTVSYMSPEQAQGRKVDARSDIFSFGVLLYEMVTGEKAFSADSSISTIASILRDEVRPISDFASVPNELEEAIRRSVRKDPGERWQTMEEMFQALTAVKQKFDSGHLTVPGIAHSAKATTQPRKRKLWIPVVAASALVVAGGLDWWWFTRQHRPATARPAEAALVPPKAAPPPTTGEKPEPRGPAVLTNQDVIAMVQANLAQSLILGQIRASETRFDLSTPELIRLAKAGVPERVIEQMRHPKGVVAAPAPAPSAPTPATVTRQVHILGGLPFPVRLLADVPAGAEAGTPLHFQAVEDYRVGDNVAIARGARVTGELMGAGKKVLGIGGKVQFRLESVTAVDGTKLKIKASPGRDSGKNQHAIEPPGRKSKDVLAPAGTEYTAYFDGDQTVAVKK
ncbi:MAG TPA: serine/threonine-protein kinase [Candidatus Acidoferrales bacterium]|nr:serine/threonine-protein kinase [Candidatus Acidoferrales bacterium]